MENIVKNQKCLDRGISKQLSGNEVLRKSFQNGQFQIYSGFSDLGLFAVIRNNFINSTYSIIRTAHSEEEAIEYVRDLINEG